MSYSPFIQPSLSQNLLQLNLNNTNDTSSPEHLFKTLLNSKSSNKPLIIQSLNILLESITTFDDNCSKYFSYLNDAFKSTANTLQSTLPPYNEIRIINSSISSFIKHFHTKYITYNDKHKSILKQLPSFISLFIKLFKSNISFLLSSSTTNVSLHAIESYFIVILTFINLYPSLLRSYQKVIEDTIENVFTVFITEHTLSLQSITTFTIVYAGLFYLSPTPHSKFTTHVDNIINAINTTVNYYQPRTLDNETATTNVNTNDLLIRVIASTNDSSNITHSIKTIDLLFDILKHVFMLIQPNTLTVVNYNTMLSCFNTIIDNISSTHSGIIDNKSHVIVNGLQRDNYTLFAYNIINNILTTMNFQCKYYTKYIYKHYTSLNTFINKTIMNHHIQSNYETYMSLLSLYETFIYNYSAVFPHIVDDIIYKMIYNSFPKAYFDYLVANDKTIINIQDTYFKLNTKKHKNTTQSVVKNEWSKDKQTMLIKRMLCIIKAYFSVEHYSMVKNWKNMLSGIVECLVLPSYAKFIFGLDEDVKKEIVCVVDCAVTSGKCVVDKERVALFLNGFYVERSDLQYICRDVLRKLNVNVNVNDNECNGEKGYIKMRNDFTGEIADLNRKIKEIVEEELKWEKERVLLGRKRKYEDEEEGGVNGKPKEKEKEKQSVHNKEIRNTNDIKRKVNDNDNEDGNIIITRNDDNVKCSHEEQILQIEHKEIQSDVKEDNNNVTKSLNEEHNDDNDIVEDDDDDDDDLVIPDIN